MSEIIRTHQYVKRELSFLKQNGHLKERYYKTLRLLAANPSHPSLGLHKLKGNLSEYCSVSINMQYRILMLFIIINDEILLINIGAHDEIY